MHMRHHALWKLFLVAAVCFSVISMGQPLHAAQELPEGSTLPKFDVPMPESPEAKEYLGLKDGDTFELSNVPAKLLVVEFFSPFCPVCQANAPKVNKIYSFIQGDPELSKDIKMVGLSLLKDEYALKVYKKNFKVQFPLIADTTKEIQEKSGVVHIPITIVADKNGKILASHLGKFSDLEEFMQEIKKFHKAQ
jgi:peroxiredoxin